MRRNTTVLASMSLVFCFCWLPQNLIYAYLDGYHDLFEYDNNITPKINVICHWIGMSSTFINPIIYGIWNTNIKKGETIFLSYKSKEYVMFSNFELYLLSSEPINQWLIM